jgi:hypothetical protein
MIFFPANRIEAVMKRLIFAACLAAALACNRAEAQQLTGFTNFGLLTDANIVIDATNVVNFGIFDLTTASSSQVQQFDFSDVQTYTNRNVMYCSTGFIFNDSPASFGNISPSAYFVNQNPGQIYGGAADLPILLPATGAATSPRIEIDATNITNSGVIQVGQAGEIAVTGGSLDLSHGSAIVESFEQAASGAVTGGPFLAAGAIDQFWGAGIQSNVFFFPNLSLNNAQTPFSLVTNSDYTTEFFSFFMSGASAIAYTNLINPSNIYTQAVVYLDAGNAGVNMNAFFLPPSSSFVSTNIFRNVVIEWGIQLNNAFGQPVSNTLFLEDGYASLPTNITFATNGTLLGGQAQLVPTNYTMGTVFRGGSLVPGNATYSQSLFTNGFGTNGNGVGEITNIYSMFSVNMQPTLVAPDANVAGSTFSNLSGRMEITANRSLNMAGTIIDAGNYLNLSSTNDFRGSQGAQIIFPYADINLGSSNGQMVISNLVAPFTARFNGPIFAWTAAWTNLTSATNVVMNGTNTPTTNSFTVTNGFLVTYVLSELQPTSPVNIGNLALRSTNMVISDVLAVSNTLLINAQNLTITSNSSTAETPEGQLIYDPTLSLADLYSANFPSMQNLTNFGTISTINAAYYQVRQNPNFPSAGDGPWQSIVNHGLIESPGDSFSSLGGGLSFWANYFENSGLGSTEAAIESQSTAFGPVFVQSSTALLSNSVAIATAGDMSFTSGNLTIVDATTLQASGFLNLAATNLLTDATAPGPGPVPNENSLSSGDGFSLLTAPTSLSGLLGTSVTSACRSNAICQNTWAGTPTTLNGGPGSVLPLMANNAPIGQLILDGGNTSSVFHFQGADQVNPYAMYVDQIKLQDGATNKNGAGKYTAFNVDPNMTIYFLKASIGNTSIAPALNGSAAVGGGNLVWLSNYVGHFSVTQVTYADGETFGVNSSYVQAYGLPPEPPVMLTPQTIMLKIGATNMNSTPMATISWYSPAYSTNTLYYRPLTGGSWQVRTNFVQGGASGRVNVLDSLGSSHLYKVSVAQ